MATAISERTRAIVSSVKHGRTPFVEKRAHKRTPYPREQRVAPIVNGRLPSAAALRPMMCRDISSGGIAFYWRSVPAFELILELGIDAEICYVRAVVKGCALDDSRNEYVVRCQFIERIAELPEQP